MILSIDGKVFVDDSSLYWPRGCYDPKYCWESYCGR